MVHPSLGEHGAKSVGIRVGGRLSNRQWNFAWNSALRNKRGSLEPPNGSFDARRAAVSRDCVVHNESGSVRGIDEPLRSYFERLHGVGFGASVVEIGNRLTLELDELASAEGVKVNAPKRASLKHSSTLDRHAIVAANLDRGDFSNGAKRPKRVEGAIDADQLGAAVQLSQHISRERRRTAMACLTGLAGLDNEDFGARVGQNFERVKAALASRSERRLAERRRNCRGQKRLALNWLFRSGAKGADFCNGVGWREHKRSPREQKPRAGSVHRVTLAL